MSVTKHTFITGFKNGLNTTWVLGKVIFPITVLITILSYTPVIGWFVALFAPIMGWIGLPGEAAIPLVLGNLLNLYAAIGGILSLQLTVKSVFILAVMLSFSHALPIETAIARKIGVNPWMVVALRLSLAIVSAITINLVWNGGQEIAQYGLIQESTKSVEGVLPILWDGISTAGLGIIQIAMIVIPLMVAIQLLKDTNLLNVLARWMTPVTSILSVGRNSAITLLAGLIFGLSFGAGVIIQSAKENHLSKRELYLLVIFLVACHAVIEDTLIFLPLGIPVWPLLLIRVIVAFVVTMLTARVWEQIVKKQMLEENNQAGEYIQK